MIVRIPFPAYVADTPCSEAWRTILFHCYSNPKIKQMSRSCSICDTHHFLKFLEALVQPWPDHELILILDNLSMNVLLWALAHPRVRFLFQPTYAPWLNLIEPWWKTLRSLALKGVRFEDETLISTSISNATHYWNQLKHPYYWRKAA
jgi:transposase